jgi:pimeloyl-ACP methyl ester carboxylesterase
MTMATTAEVMVSSMRRNMFGTIRAQLLNGRTTATTLQRLSKNSFVTSTATTTTATTNAPPLHFETIGTSSSSLIESSSSASIKATSTNILFLHGLLGNGRNLKTLASKVCAQHQASTSSSAHHHVAGLLMDLRGHGKSAEPQHLHLAKSPHNFEACVQDVTDTLVHAGSRYYPKIVVGHSWGGRVALQYAATTRTVPDNHQEELEGLHQTLDRVWLLDTVPGEANESVERVIRAVTSFLQGEPMEPLTRKQVVDQLTLCHGLDKGLAQWLASSYTPQNRTTGEQQSFGFDLDVVHGILPEFEHQDFWGLVETCCLEQNVRVDLVRGGKNTGWTVDILRKLSALQKERPSHFQVHVLPKAGHWVHTDDLPGLLQLMNKP